MKNNQSSIFALFYSDTDLCNQEVENGKLNREEDLTFVNGSRRTESVPVLNS